MAHPALGRKGKDKITGFSGTVTGFVEYITGCNQLLLIPPVGKDGKTGDGQWFDEQRVDLTGKPIVLDNSKSNGPDKPAPIR
jgi:hypothetical protein